MNKVKPVSSEEYLKGPFESLPIDPEGGLLVLPDPGFVFKTKEVKNGGKVFINMVHHPIIDKPESKEMVELDVGYLSRFRMSRVYGSRCQWETSERTSIIVCYVSQRKRSLQGH